MEKMPKINDGGIIYTKEIERVEELVFNISKSLDVSIKRNVEHLQYSVEENGIRYTHDEYSDNNGNKTKHSLSNGKASIACDDESINYYWKNGSEKICLLSLDKNGDILFPHYNNSKQALQIDMLKPKFGNSIIDLLDFSINNVGEESSTKQEIIEGFRNLLQLGKKDKRSLESLDRRELEEELNKSMENNIKSEEYTQELIKFIQFINDKYTDLIHHPQIGDNIDELLKRFSNMTNKAFLKADFSIEFNRFDRLINSIISSSDFYPKRDGKITRYSIEKNRVTYNCEEISLDNSVESKRIHSLSYGNARIIHSNGKLKYCAQINDQDAFLMCLSEDGTIELAGIQDNRRSIETQSQNELSEIKVNSITEGLERAIESLSIPDEKKQEILGNFTYLRLPDDTIIEKIGDVNKDDLIKGIKKTRNKLEEDEIIQLKLLDTIGEAFYELQNLENIPFKGQFITEHYKELVDEFKSEFPNKFNSLISSIQEKHTDKTVDEYPGNR